MIHSFLNDLDTWYIVIILFFSMLTAWIGYKIGLKKTNSENKNVEISSSLLGLLALILGFTFAMAGSLYENSKKQFN